MEKKIPSSRWNAKKTKTNTLSVSAENAMRSLVSIVKRMPAKQIQAVLRYAKLIQNPETGSPIKRLNMIKEISERLDSLSYDQLEEIDLLIDSYGQYLKRKSE